MAALSLVEVLVAVCICAVTVVGVVALLGPAVRDTREVADRHVVHSLAERVGEELRRAGYAAVTAATASSAPLQLVASADGTRIVQLTDADNDQSTGNPPGIAAPERYFLVEVVRALRPVSGPACIVLEVRVSWPLALPPDGTPVPPAQRSEFLFHTAINP